VQRAPEELDPLTDELDCTFAPELDATTDELDLPIEELEELTTEDELSPSVSVPLFPLSPPHAAKISATVAMPNNATRCFCFICSLLLAVNHWLS